VPLAVSPPLEADEGAGAAEDDVATAALLEPEAVALAAGGVDFLLLHPATASTAAKVAAVR
jgi:flavoprotein